MRWRGQPGRYEVWYLTFADRDSGAGFWIRQTVLAPDVGPAASHTWFACFPPDGPPWGVTGAGALLPPPMDRVQGRTLLAGHAARWDLALASPHPAEWPLPGLAYLPGVAGTAFASPFHGAMVSGTVEADGRVFEIRRGVGTRGHVWGRRHAEAWAWVHAAGFKEDPGAALVAISARAAHGGRETPWLTSMELTYGGRRLAFKNVLANRCAVAPPTYRFSATGVFASIDGEVSATPDRMIRAEYTDPDGRPAWCHNSEVASCRVRIQRRAAPGLPWREAGTLTATGLASAEWGARVPWDGVRQAFAVGRWR